MLPYTHTNSQISSRITHKVIFIQFLAQNGLSNLILNQKPLLEELCHVRRVRVIKRMCTIQRNVVLIKQFSIGRLPYMCNVTTFAIYVCCFLLFYDSTNYPIANTNVNQGIHRIYTAVYTAYTAVGPVQLQCTIHQVIQCIVTLGLHWVHYSVCTVYTAVYIQCIH